MKRPSDAQALTAVLAYDRCQELAARATDECIRDAWLRDAETAWDIMQRWLGAPENTQSSGKSAP